MESARRGRSYRSGLQKPRGARYRGRDIAQLPVSQCMHDACRVSAGGLGGVVGPSAGTSAPRHATRGLGHWRAFASPRSALAHWKRVCIPQICGAPCRIHRFSDKGSIEIGRLLALPLSRTSDSGPSRARTSSARIPMLIHKRGVDIMSVTD